MKLTVERGELRRVLMQLTPHIGEEAKNEDDKRWQPYGRLRIAVSPHDRIVFWTGDALTRACASLAVLEYRSDEAPIFDLAKNDVAMILKTFKPSGSLEDKSMWNSGRFELELAQEKFHIRELHEFGIAGKELALPLSWLPGAPADTYPDFPAAIISVLQANLEPAIESYPAREALFRILAAVHADGRVRIIESSRNALVITGTKDFTAIVPAQILRSHWRGATEPPPDSFQEVIAMLTPFVQPIDETTEAGKTRATVTRGLTLATKPTNKPDN